MGYLLRWIK